MGVRRLFLKDEGRNPTSSFKDRASAVGVAKALEFAYRAIACASTGNAASSLAGCAESGGRVKRSTELQPRNEFCVSIDETAH